MHSSLDYGLNKGEQDYQGFLDGQKRKLHILIKCLKVLLPILWVEDLLYSALAKEKATLMVNITWSGTHWELKPVQENSRYLNLRNLCGNEKTIRNYLCTKNLNAIFILFKFLQVFSNIYNTLDGILINNTSLRTVTEHTTSWKFHLKYCYFMILFPLFFIVQKRIC